MKYKIALAGNPNSGKTTLFNSLTGANQFVGNWPGVTVEKKEGLLKRHREITITDLPGIYSLSPYTPEEKVARHYLTTEHPDLIVNIVDASNLERNLYLSTQLSELGIPMLMLLNMSDVVEKRGDHLDAARLGEHFGCPAAEICAVSGQGLQEAEALILSCLDAKVKPLHQSYGERIDEAIDGAEKLLQAGKELAHSRWYAVKALEGDTEALQGLELSESCKKEIRNIREALEKSEDDDVSGVLSLARYEWIAGISADVLKKNPSARAPLSDRIDRVLTSRWLGLPIFALVMFVVYYISMVTIGTAATDWANDGLFGDGWHLFGMGAAEWEEADETYQHALLAAEAFTDIDPEAEDFDEEEALSQLDGVKDTGVVGSVDIIDEETLEKTTLSVYYDKIPELTDEEKEGVLDTSFVEARAYFDQKGFEAPAPENYGTWVRGVPVLIADGLEKANAAPWLEGLIVDGIVAGVGAVLGFVPQMLVLFLLLSMLEACGYMARIAFVLDRIFRKFGLSGKSFIPMLIASGCGVPAIMASRTIEQERDRRMTVMTCTFIPCSAKLPFIAMVSGAIFGGSPLIANSSYFVGMAAVIISGIILKKSRVFSGDPAPFVMELPPYHWPRPSQTLRTTWERGSSFIKRAGTIILLSTIFVWFTSFFGFVDGSFRMLEESELDHSVLAAIGSCIAWIFTPLGWGNWRSAVASFTGLVAKENIVATLGILYETESMSVWQSLQEAFTPIAGYSFLVFNLLCAPCFAAIGAVRREMNSRRWTWLAIGWQTGIAYAVSLMIYQFGSAVRGETHLIGFIFASLICVLMLYLLFRPAKEPKEPETLAALS